MTLCSSQDPCHSLMSFVLLWTQHDPEACGQAAAMLRAAPLRAPCSDQGDIYKLDWVSFALTIRPSDFSGLLLREEARAGPGGEGVCVVVRTFDTSASGDRVSESAIRAGDILFKVGGSEVKTIANAEMWAREAQGSAALQLQFLRQ